MNPDEEESPEHEAESTPETPDTEASAEATAEIQAPPSDNADGAIHLPESAESAAIETQPQHLADADEQRRPIYQEAEAPRAADPPPSLHEAAAKQLNEAPLAEIERRYPASAEPLQPASVFDGDDSLFGEPDIPMPQPASRAGDRQRRRDAKRNLDLDLGRIKRRKRYGLFITSISVLFIAFVLAPVTWAASYLFFDPPSTVLMMQRAAEGETIRHYPVPLNRMSPHIVRAVIAAEDANFCTHDGFDVDAIQDALESNRRGGRLRGGSTVSQQTAKNLFLWPDRGWVRKGFETYFTALIEFLWPKRRIMEAYLNAAEWGDGNFGIEAAARARFGVSAADLTPLQAARLAAVLPSPNRWRADAPGPYVRGRASTIVARAREVRASGAASCVLLMDRSGGR